MKTCILIALLVAQVVLAENLTLSARPKVVFIKDWQVFSVYADGTGLKQLTTGGGRKHHPVWSPDGSRIAYRVKPQDALSQLTVITDSGERVADITIRPDTIQMGRMRFIEDLKWLNSSQVALEGSLNPVNCEYVVLDITSGKEVEWHFGTCGTFVRSPDGKLVAYWAVEGTGLAEEKVRDVLEISNTQVYPSQRTSRFLSKPAWSADGRKVALIDRDANSGVVSLTVVDGKPDLTPGPKGPACANFSAKLAEVIMRVPLAPDVDYSDHSGEVQWVGNAFVVTKNGEALNQADPVRRIGQPAAADTVQTVREVTARRTQAAQLKRSADALMRKLGGNGLFDVWTGPPEQLQSDHEQ